MVAFQISKHTYSAILLNNIFIGVADYLFIPYPLNIGTERRMQ